MTSANSAPLLPFKTPNGLPDSFHSFISYARLVLGE